MKEEDLQLKNLFRILLSMQDRISSLEKAIVVHGQALIQARKLISAIENK